MTTLVLPIDPRDPDLAVIGRAAAAIRAGELVAFPTETVYGLGADALAPAAVGRIFAAKGRPATNPVIVHVADPGQVSAVAASWPAAAAELADRFWPGPLTLVVPKRPDVPDAVTAGGPTVAVRCPAHPIARSLIRAAGVPVAAPSANRSTALSPTRAGHVLDGLNGRVGIVLDGGPCPGGIESTVVDVSGGVVRLLRPGLISGPMLESVVGRVEVGPAHTGVARSPGQMARHYSPQTPVTLVPFGGLRADQLRAAFEDGRTAVLGFEASILSWLTGEIPAHFNVMPDHPESYAADLYAALHRVDAAGYGRILVELPPDTPDWAAVRDRLTRAAASG